MLGLRDSGLNGSISSARAFAYLAAAALFGYAPAEVIGQNVSMLMPAPYRNERDAYISNYLRTGEVKIIGVGREVEGQRKDGSIFPMELGVSVVEAEGRRFFVGFIHDLSERRLISKLACRNSMQTD